MGIENQETPKLSHVLIDRLFFSALGTTEQRDGKPNLVRLGTPYTHDTNNAIMAIYDERGRPWVAGIRAWDWTDVDRELERIGRESGTSELLKPGAYVPHSNDGGLFLREVMIPLRESLAGKNDELRDAVKAETERVEKELIKRALLETNGDRKLAAKKLQISQSSLAKKMHELSIFA